MAPVPNYAAGTAPTTTVRITTANTNRDGTGTIATVFEPGVSPASGSGVNVPWISAKANGTLGAGGSQVVVYLWNATTSTWDAVDEFNVPAATPGTTAASGKGSIVFADPTKDIPGLTVPYGSKLGVSATVMPTGPSTPAILVNVQASNY